MSHADNLRKNIDAIESRIAAACAAAGRARSAVLLIAVTKTHSLKTVQTLIDLGITDFGENRVQEIVVKAPMLEGNRVLHMIGHLQTNKVAAVLPHVTWIHSIDRLRLVERIEHCFTAGKKIQALVEVNTSAEASKSGCLPQECRMLCERVAASPALDFRGLMTIGPLDGDEIAVRRSFKQLRSLSESCADLAEDNIELSMGMSDDFELAIEEGATMVRIGSAILGHRQE